MYNPHSRAFKIHLNKKKNKHMKQTLTLPKNFPNPRKRSVIVKRINQGSLTTESGIELLETAANTQRPNVGIIYAVGSEVPDDLKPGLKVYYNQYADLEIIIDGLPYFLMHDEDIKCVLNESDYVMPLVKTAKEVRLEKKIPENDKRIALSAKIEANNKDKRAETYKKSIKKAPKNK